MIKKWAIIFAVIFQIMCLSGCSSGDSSSEGQSSPSGSQSGSSSGSSSDSSSGSSSGSSEGGTVPSEDPKSGIISAGGSTALQPLLTQAVNPFTSSKEFKGSITINGTNSVQGLIDVSAGKIDIALSDISPEQAGKDGMGLVDHQVGIVGIGVVVSADVASNLTDISVSDLNGIFTGKITDWKQIAGWKGISLPISVYYHKSGSGIRYLFEQFGIMASLTDEQITKLKNFTATESPAHFEKAMEAAKGAIGYEALPFCGKQKLLKVEGYEATYENIYSGKYKIWGCEHLYTKGEPTGAAKAFIEFVTSEEFGETITSNGYGMISEMKVVR